MFEYPSLHSCITSIFSFASLTNGILLETAWKSFFFRFRSRFLLGNPSSSSSARDCLEILLIPLPLRNISAWKSFVFFRFRSRLLWKPLANLLILLSYSLHPSIHRSFSSSVGHICFESQPSSVTIEMAAATCLVSPPVSFSRRKQLPSLRNVACVALRCCAVVASGIDGEIFGATSLKPRIPRLVGMGSKLVGCGSAVPKHMISNDDLAEIVETSDEWISVRTGIRNRRVLTGDETLNGLALEAAEGALQMAGVVADDVDLIIMCTSTPDDLFGGGGQIQRDLGCRNAWAFDITAACSGFVIGLITATRFIKGGGYQNILVIGADALSRYVDWTDRGTCILFGDAAGAVLVQACSADEDGLLGFDLHSDGQGQRLLNAPTKDNEANILKTNGAAIFPSRKATYSFIQMNGTEVFRFALNCVPQSIEIALEEAGLTFSSIDWLLLHQANQRIIDAVAARLQIPSEKIISNLANYGNTSAASIPLALDEAVRAGKVKAGDMIAVSGFGAGLTWGSAIVRWG